MIWYEPHPVSPERKRELVAQGFRIIDARYQPRTGGEAVVQADAEQADVKPKSTAEIRAALDAAGVVYPPSAKKAELLALLERGNA